MKITRAGISHIEELITIGKQTFYETFSSDNSEENMAEYLATAFSKERIKSELADPNTEFYFAELDNSIVGYLKINLGKSQTELKESHALEIERIYVLQEFQGRKVGQLLFNKAIDIAKGNPEIAYVWLGVWERNPKAIRFYEKNGFVPFDKHVFKLGDDEQTDIMMKMELG